MLKDETYRNIRLTLMEKIADLMRVMDIPANGLTIGEAHRVGQGITRIVRTADNMARDLSKLEQ